MKRRRVWLWVGVASFLAVICAVVLVVIAFVAWIVVQPGWISYTTSLNPGEVEFAGHHFRVPRAYLGHVDQQWGVKEEDYGKGVFMAGTLPDIAPYSEETAHFYKGGEGLRQKVSFSLWIYKKSAASPSEYYFRPETLKQCAEEQGGYRVCPPQYGVLGKNEVLVKIDGKRRFAFDCSKYGTVPSEHCGVDLPLVDDIELHIFFSRDHFDEAERIVAKVYELVCGFYLPDQGREANYNYCTNGVYHGR